MNNIATSVPNLLDAKAIDNRLYQRLTLVETFSLALCVGLVCIFAWFQSQGNAYAYDFNTYIWAGNGDLRVHYYAFWILPVFKALTAVPYTIGFIIWNMANIAGVFVALRIVGGGNKVPFALFTYQMFYTLYYGNIIGILLGGLALYWWGLTHRRWYTAGIGLVIALTKYQLGLSFGLIFLLIVDISWHNRLRVLVVPFVVFLLSLVFYPLWPVESIQIILNNPPNSLGNISLWRWLGPFALILWFPPLFLQLPAQSRLVALAATAALALPYFQQTDLLALFVLPIGWLPLVGNLGFYLFGQHSWDALSLLFILPMTIYLWVIGPSLFLKVRYLFSR